MANGIGEAGIALDTFLQAPTNTAPNQEDVVLTDVQRSINAIYEIINKYVRDIDPLKRKRATIANRLKNARAYLKKIKEEITLFKSTRKRSGDGIESEIFKILKVQYGIKLQAYHGGTMTGKDIQKVMSNATQMFATFAAILKANKRLDSKFDTEKNIDYLCHSFANCFVVWDGAFSFENKISPSHDDVIQYRRFVTAAVLSHVELGCNVTPKVHMMWSHVVDGMMMPGGLEQNREDWVEHHHHIMSRERVQFGNTNDPAV